ncbi:Hypothetical protein, putative [Bodo saltans]|uniref:Uncharacterized protein n=1 Tax=Bodo saltans TaxID=75058 RepID=A0A0S4J6K8_BODSA|nr:Hypothetical protein, putative [Bodo saltans]|eukprot:CUG83056.1 Hypothetical protein, putative [Bodo saltans]
MPLDLPVERQFRHNPYSASGRVILLPRQPSADAELLVGPLTNDSAHAPTKPMAFAIPTTPTPPNTTTAPQSVCSCIMKETAPTVPSLDKNISASMSNSELCDIHELKFSVACAKEGNPKTSDGSVEQRTEASWLFTVKVVSTNGTAGLDLSIKLPCGSISSYKATIRCEHDAPKIWHDVTGVDKTENDDLLRALAVIAAAYGLTSGGKEWLVSCGSLMPSDKTEETPTTTTIPQERQPIPFSIGRVFLDIVDGNTEIAKFGTRGRGKGVVTFTTTLRPMKRDRSPTKDDQSPKEDVLDITSNVSHPQLPLLRVVVQSLAVNRTLHIKGFRVKWQGLPTGDAVAPLALRIIPRETPIYVDSPTIMLEVNPVKKE